MLKVIANGRTYPTRSLSSAKHNFEGQELELCDHAFDHSEEGWVVAVLLEHLYKLWLGDGPDVAAFDCLNREEPAMYCDEGRADDVSVV